jgi:hypothetical protein
VEIKTETVSSEAITLRHWRRFSRAPATGGAAALKIRGNAAWILGTYEAPATPNHLREVDN